MRNFFIQNHASSRKGFSILHRAPKKKEVKKVKIEPEEVVPITHGSGVGVNTTSIHPSYGAVYSKTFNPNEVLTKEKQWVNHSKPVITNFNSPNMSKLVSGMGNLDFSTGVKSTKRKNIKLIV